MAQSLRVGVIGTGAVSGAYLSMARNFPAIEIAALADIDADKAHAKAAEFNIAQVASVDDLLKDQSIHIILNLTIPRAHAEISLRALESGKHIFSEKPLAISVPEGRQIISLAKSRNLRVGCAPDTFLGSGIQTARKLLDDGVIGRPIGFTAFMMGRGHESWHPNPEFYYQPGGGPMFDMGPYYLTALLQFFGPIRRIMGLAKIAIPQRTITSQPKAGKQITVQTPDHILGCIDFDNDVTGTIITTFAAHYPQYDPKQPITIYGEHGTIRVPDPNQFDGPVQLRKEGDADWTLIPPATPTGLGRSVGLADMCQGIRDGREHRATGDQASYVLEAMQSFLDSSSSGRAVRPTGPYHRPEPLPPTWDGK